jgi:glycerophosphoryl diester phosphodiesterase
MLEIASRRIRVTGHRGNSVLAPENTMAAFRAAVAGGADAVETDVQLTADGVPILFHDADLERMAGADALVSHLELKALRRFDVGAGECVPTLAELAELCRGRVGLLLDLKVEGALPAIAEVIAGTGYPPGEVTICAWTADQARDARLYLPDSHLVLLAEGPLEHDDAWFAALAATGFSGISIAWQHCTGALVDRAHRADLTVTVWTVNDAVDARRAASFGVDNIITDDPTALHVSVGRGSPDS